MRPLEQRQESAFSRRNLLKGAALVGAVPALKGDDEKEPSSAPMLLYIGTYTPNGEGIYLYSMDPGTGKLTKIKVAANVPSPSWIALHPSGKYLYAVNEISNFNGGTSGSVTSFSVNRGNGDLTLLNVKSSEGAGPAHLSVDPLGKFVYVANYGGGSFAVLPILDDGSLANASDVHVDTGSVGPTHATHAPLGSFSISGHDAPHGHMIQSDLAGRYVFGADLGQDRIYSWVLNRQTGKLLANDPAYVSIPAGDGPRHFAFHPNGRWFYSLQEESSTLMFFTYNPATGKLTEVQIISSLPPGFAGTDFTSEVRVSKDGKRVYAANRLHDTISVFNVNSSGLLSFAGEASTKGDYPRSFTIDPSGRYLYSCNQRSDAVTSFRVSGEEEGPLRFTGMYVPVGNPACIVFLT